MTDQEGAAMTPDIVTEARRLLDAATPGPWYCFTDDSAGKDSLHLMSEYDDGSWVEGKQGPFPLDPFTYDPTPMERATAHFIAAAPRLVAELVAEVERLRHELDQRTDPELAARLSDMRGGSWLRAQDIIAALDAAGYDIVARDPRPARCPRCGAYNPLPPVGDYEVRCTDPWHGGAE